MCQHKYFYSLLNCIRQSYYYSNFTARYAVLLLLFAFMRTFFRCAPIFHQLPKFAYGYLQCIILAPH